MDPRERITEIERNPYLPSGDRERFRGYAVIGLPLRSGHILGLRRWPASSIGPEYTPVWHRVPDGHWTFYTNVAPRISCDRYFGAAIDVVHEREIDIDWNRPQSFRVTTDGGEIDWSVTLATTPISRALTAFCSNHSGIAI